MSREVHVRFREGAGVRVPRATRLVIGCERKEDARRMMAVLPKRFARFGLIIHPTKTVLVSFKRPGSKAESDAGNGTFECLGLTHYWTKARRGSWVIKRRTARKRLRRTMKALWQWCRHHRHTAVREQYRSLCQKRRGHFQDSGIRGNYPRLAALFRYAEGAWRYWLSRRGHRHPPAGVQLEWLRARYPLPVPRIVHAI